MTKMKTLAISKPHLKLASEAQGKGKLRKAQVDLHVNASTLSVILLKMLVIF